MNPKVQNTSAAGDFPFREISELVSPSELSNVQSSAKENSVIPEGTVNPKKENNDFCIYHGIHRKQFSRWLSILQNDMSNESE